MECVRGWEEGGPGKLGTGSRRCWAGAAPDSPSLSKELGAIKRECVSDLVDKFKASKSLA